MYIKLSFALSLFIFVLCSSTIDAARSSPLRVEKDAAVYQLLEKYHHYSDLNRLLEQWASNYSQLAQMFSVGKSFTGRSLSVMRLTSPMRTETEIAADENLLLKPKFKWIANMHGDETVGREMMMALIYYLLLNAKSDARVNRLLSGTDIYIMPTMNPVEFRRSFSSSSKFFFRSGWFRKQSRGFMRFPEHHWTRQCCRRRFESELPLTIHAVATLVEWKHR